ncbi:MAG: phosphohydrolase, partial [Janthinobacterium lividum]
MTTTIDRNPRPYVLLPSGNVIDLAAPSPTSWTDADLAIGLSRTYRWGGHSAWKRPLSVAQHSLTVLGIRERDIRLEPRLALYELLHDAEEGLIGFDCIA